VRTILIAAAGSILFAAVAAGQQPSQRESTDAASIASYVPSSTHVFISLRRLTDVNQALQQTKAWRFVPLLSGKPLRDDASFDLRSIVKGFLGAESKIDADDLMKSEIGLVAPSWSQLGRAIWLIRVPDDEVLDRWFPQEGLRRGDSSRAARVFRTDDGMTVCVRGRVVALARRGGDWAQLGSILRLMAGRGGDVLEETAAYRELVAYLPGRPLAIVYSAQSPPMGREGVADEPGADDPPANPERTVIGVYATGGRIELAVRGATAQRHGRTPIAPYAVERMLTLPQTTLLAYATSVDWKALARRETDGGRGGTLQRYLDLLSGLRRHDPSSEAASLHMGKHIIAAWDQDLSGDGSTPQLAFLIECRDARAFAEEARGVAESFRSLVSAIEQSDVGEVLPLKESTHLGVRIGSVPLRAYAEKSRFSWVKILSNLEPSWAASGDWFIITLTRDHLERILDAQIGFVSVLGDVRDARAFREHPEQYSAIAVGQGGLAATVLDRWLHDTQVGGPSLLNGALWGDRNPSELFDPGRLGIEMASDGEPGFVEVAGVEPFTPADGRLAAGDRILGVDGRLLELASPADDLRRWWEQSEAGSSHTLRVLRKGSIIELQISRREDDVRLTNLLVQPVDALRELAALGRAIPFASLQVHATDERHFSALVTLRLSSASP
jgi:hypothetical protein